MSLGLEYCFLSAALAFSGLTWFFVFAVSELPVYYLKASLAEVVARGCVLELSELGLVF